MGTCEVLTSWIGTIGFCCDFPPDSRNDILKQSNCKLQKPSKDFQQFSLPLRNKLCAISVTQKMEEFRIYIHMILPFFGTKTATKFWDEKVSKPSWSNSTQKTSGPNLPGRAALIHWQQGFHGLPNGEKANSPLKRNMELKKIPIFPF